LVVMVTSTLSLALEVAENANASVNTAKTERFKSRLIIFQSSF